MNCPICNAELEFKSFTVGESEATSYYYCANCDNNLQTDGKGHWDVILTVECYKDLLTRPVVQGRPMPTLDDVLGAEECQQ